MTLKDLKQIVELCRSSGIVEYKFNGLELKFAPTTTTKSNQKQLKPRKAEKIGAIPDTTSGPTVPEVPWAKLTDEQIATWSSQQEESEA